MKQQVENCTVLLLLVLFFKTKKRVNLCPILPPHTRSILDSIVVSIPACHAGDQGSIPCRGARFQQKYEKRIFGLSKHGFISSVTILQAG